MANSFLRYNGRSDDWQDGVERHIHSELEYHDAGAIIKVKGTDSEDQEANVLVMGGVGMNLKKDTDAEVFLLASSSDTHLKMAIQTTPFNKQRRWPEDEGGIQHPTDPEVSLHFSDKLTHVTKNKFAVGEKGELEVKEKNGYLRLDKVIITGELIVNKRVKTPEVVSGSEDPPGFEGNKQAEKKQSGSGGGGGGGSSPAVAAADPNQLDLFSEQQELVLW